MHDIRYDPDRTTRNLQRRRLPPFPANAARYGMKTDELATRWRYDPVYLGNLRRSGKGPAWFQTPMGGIRYPIMNIIEAELRGTAGPLNIDHVSMAIASCEDLPKEQRAKLIEHVKFALRPGGSDGAG